MFIKQFEVQNFKNIQKAQFEFEKINVIYGENGSGKSSVLEAISYVITNKLGARLEDYISRGKDFFQIRSNIDHKGINYKYSIKNQKNTEKTLAVKDTDGEITNYKNTSATKHLAEVIDPILAYYSSISLQGKSTSILFDSSTDRKIKLEAILGIDKFREVSAAMKEDADALDSQGKKIKSEISILENLVFNLLPVPGISTDINSLKKEFKVLETEIKIYKLEIDKYIAYTIQKTTYEKYVNTFNSIQEKIEQHEIAITKEVLLPEPLSNKQEIDTLLKEIQFLENKIQLSDIEQQVYNDYVLSLTDLQLKLEAKEIDLKKYILKLISDKEVLYDQQDILNKELSNLRLEVALLENNLELIKVGKCPKCKKEYSGDLEGVTKDILFKKQQIETIKNQVNELELKINEIIKSEQENTTNKKLREVIEQEIEFLNNNLQSLTDNPKKEPIPNQINLENLDLKQTQYGKLKLQEDSLEELKKRNQKTQQSIDMLTNTITIYQTQLKELQTVQNPIEIEKPKEDSLTKEARFKELEKEINIYDELIKQRNTVIEHNNKIEQDKKDNQTKIKELYKDFDKIQFQHKILVESRNCVNSEMSPYLIEFGVEEIINIMNELFLKIYYKQYNIQFKQDKTSIDFFYQDYVVPDCVSPIDVAGGFEQQAISLAFRIALTILSGTRILVLDEADSDSSNEHSIRLFNTILDLDCFDQIFIVTHKKSTQEFLENDWHATVFKMEEGAVK
jgi:exonuclease SbcC